MEVGTNEDHITVDCSSVSKVSSETIWVIGIPSSSTFLTPTPGRTYLSISSPQVSPCCVPETDNLFCISSGKDQKNPCSLLHGKSGDVPWDVRETHMYKALQKLFKRHFLLILWRIGILVFKLRSQQLSLRYNTTDYKADNSFLFLQCSLRDVQMLLCTVWHFFSWPFKS